MTTPRLDTRDRLRVWLWSLGLQGSWNPQRMQNLGLLATLVAWRSRRPHDLEDDRHFCRRYYEFFNTNPYLANFLVGGLIHLEQQAAAGQTPPPGLIRMFRDSLGRALASLGDQLFWMGLRPAFTLALCLLGLIGWWWAALGLVVCFAAGQLVLRWISLEQGLRLGMDLVDVVSARGWHRAVALVRRSGMILAGALGGLYVLRLQDVAASVDASLLIMGAAFGMVVPLVLRRRLPGEFLMLLAFGLALALTFAIPESGG
ncbi:MAG TPA: PTS system mannose/fructose/sorbose family transporter subunit IID [Candidatus Krumholzibacteria bacterium]|nr:PTS system mannose/fructose/sorbose family transporter subunit IID [Candidatus Krumholzibacteria bacterium]